MKNIKLFIIPIVLLLCSSVYAADNFKGKYKITDIIPACYTIPYAQEVDDIVNERDWDALRSMLVQEKCVIIKKNTQISVYDTKYDWRIWKLRSKGQSHKLYFLYQHFGEGFMKKIK